MPQYVVYRATESINLKDVDDGMPHYVVFDESDIKIGLVNPHSNPLLKHDPDGTIEAKNPAAALAAYNAKRIDSFH